MTEQTITDRPLRLAILGAGGIGCYYGSRLSATGHAIVFIARGEHLLALQDKGLCLRHPDFEFNGPVDACNLAGFVKRFQPSDIDAMLICVKATATPDVATVIAQWFKATGQETAVVSLQNGVDNEPQLVEVLGEHTVLGGLAVRIGGHIASPGVVEATGIAQIILGAWPHAGGLSDDQYGHRLRLLVKVFNEAGIPAKQVDNIRYELWRKLIINNGVNPLSALTHLDTRALSHHPEFGPLVLALMQETARAAEADSEQLLAQDVDEMYALIRGFDPIKTSMLVDLEKGRPLEVDAICGAVLKRSEQLGIAAPYTQTVSALLRHAVSSTK
jgi:2-dehydropantoate 2-reductase